MWVNGLRRARRVPAPSQFVRGGKSALLQVVERMIASSSLPVPGYGSIATVGGRFQESGTICFC